MIRLNGNEGLTGQEGLLTAAPTLDEWYAEMGRKVLDQAGEDACQSGYGTTDPEWVGRYAIMYNDVDADGNLT